MMGVAASILLPARTAAMQQGLTPVIYYITNPALMFTLCAETELREAPGRSTPLALITAATAAAL